MKYPKLPRQASFSQPPLPRPARSCTACIIENNHLAADYLASTLRQDPQIEVCLFDDYVSSGAHGSPLVFCLDQANAVLPVRASLHLLKAAYPESKCILLDVETNSDHMRLLLDSSINGLLRHHNVREWLLEAVRSVARGQLWIHPEFVHSMPPEVGRIPGRARAESLTPRESEILQLVTSHFSNKEISMLLAIEESTVKFHLSNILAKRNVSRREDLAASKISEGWRTLLLAGAHTAHPALRTLLR